MSKIATCNVFQNCFALNCMIITEVIELLLRNSLQEPGDSDVEVGGVEGEQVAV